MSSPGAALAWHYTTGQAAVLIVRSGRLEPRPLLWFSMRQDVDPSACRVVLVHGRPHRLTVGEMARMFAGWFRFGITAAELVPADQVRIREGITRAAWRRRVAIARLEGSDVGQWYASSTPIALERCTVQRLDGLPGRGDWQAIEDPRAWMAARLDEEIAEAWRKMEVCDEATNRTDRAQCPQ